MLELRYYYVTKVNLRFINHSCIQIVAPAINILVDPWFSGKVFNESWQLLLESRTTLTRGITHILISHEHPDHLSFHTLKSLREDGFLAEECSVLFPSRPESSVKNAVEKIVDTPCIYAARNIPLQFSEEMQIGFYGETEGGDHSIAIKYQDHFILHQNDHYTSEAIANLLLEDFGRPNLLLTQFSLAGYYGNKRDWSVINNNGTLWHLNKIKEFNSKFMPLRIVPFASLVWFCDEWNYYLNEHVITPRILNNFAQKNSIPLLFVAPGDDIPVLEKDILKYDNISSLSSLNKLFDSMPLRGYVSEKCFFRELQEVFLILSKKANAFRRLRFTLIFYKSILMMRNSKNYRLRDVGVARRSSSLILKFCSRLRVMMNSMRGLVLHPWRILPISVIRLIDTGESFLFSPLLSGIIFLPFYIPDYFVDLRVPSRQVRFLMKFPWGSDTLNITATEEVFSVNGEMFVSFCGYILRR